MHYCNFKFDCFLSRYNINCSIYCCICRVFMVPWNNDLSRRLSSLNRSDFLCKCVLLLWRRNSWRHGLALTQIQIRCHFNNIRWLRRQLPFRLETEINKRKKGTLRIDKINKIRKVIELSIGHLQIQLSISERLLFWVKRDRYGH